MKCRITVLGVVQGVGYRPFTARLAEEEGIRGSVRNSGGAVHIEAYAGGEAMERLIHRLRSCAPPAARVEQVRVDTIEQEEGDGCIPASFSIIESEQENPGDVPLPSPDLPVCRECLAEMADPAGRRYRYPFISCVNCGPRYSIMERLPYDREHTAMRDFWLCPDCGGEYGKKGDRRRHAQTISCHSCGPQLLVRIGDGREGHGYRLSRTAGETPGPQLPLAAGKGPAPRFAAVSGKVPGLCGPSCSDGTLRGEEGLRACVNILKRGGILALKGIGGYQLACRPDCPEAVERLRRLKRRDKKPFALMFPSLERIRELCQVSAQEEELLLSPARPIVLLAGKGEWRKGESPFPFSRNLCSESRFLGAFLPYTGLHQLLTQEAGPLVMTSANASGDPILTEEVQMEELWQKNPGLLDAVAWNQRRILTPLDDSLMRVTGGKNQMLRRSRGFVPAPAVLPEGEKFEKTLLCMGGDLKTVFCLAAGSRAYLSQYFGDMENYRCLQAYREGISHMEGLLGIRPERVVCDLHPGYVTLAEGRRIAGEQGLFIQQVQHHHAHAASVMAEHGLSHCIGVVFDGTGYGTDGHVWGGEFLLCRGASFQRMGHLEEAELCGGDASARDAALNAACHLAQAGLRPRKEAAEIWRDRLELAQKALQYHINTERSSSMGRLFDAVSALLGIRESNSYEGECASALEHAAWEGRPERAEGSRTGEAETGAARAPEPEIRVSFPIWEEDGVLIAGRSELIRQLLERAAEEGEPGRAEKRQPLRKEAEGPQTAVGERRPGKMAEGREEEGSRALTGRLAWAFHEAAARMTLSMCRRIREKTGERNVALSGGVFANVILQERCRQLLEAEGFAVYVNESVPGNDGGICLGQAWIARQTEAEQQNLLQKR